MMPSVDFNFFNATKKAAVAAIAAGAVVVVQELTKTKVVPIFAGPAPVTAPEKPVPAPVGMATTGSAGRDGSSPPGVTTTVPQGAGTDEVAHVPAPPVEVKATGQAGGLISDARPAEPGPAGVADPAALDPAPAKVAASPSPLGAVYRGEFDRALEIGRADDANGALVPGLENFADAGRRIEKAEWIEARDALRQAERTPQLRRLSIYWRCRISKLEIGSENFDRCAPEAGIAPGTYR